MIEKEEVLKIANLTKLKLDENEINMFMEDLSIKAEYACLGETENIEFEGICSMTNVFNEDVVIASFDREEILKNREGGENGYFTVRRRGL